MSYKKYGSKDGAASPTTASTAGPAVDEKVKKGKGSAKSSLTKVEKPGTTTTTAEAPTAASGPSTEASSAQSLRNEFGDVESPNYKLGFKSSSNDKDLIVPGNYFCMKTIENNYEPMGP